jgi:hypothetical protein
MRRVKIASLRLEKLRLAHFGVTLIALELEDNRHCVVEALALSPDG